MPWIVVLVCVLFAGDVEARQDKYGKAKGRHTYPSLTKDESRLLELRGEQASLLSEGVTRALQDIDQLDEEINRTDTFSTGVATISFISFTVLCVFVFLNNRRLKNELKKDVDYLIADNRELRSRVDALVIGHRLPKAD